MSSMQELVQEYLEHRRKLGYALKVEGAELLRFARFADEAGECEPLTVELAVRWAQLPRHAHPIYRARRLDMVRRFAKHRALFDSGTQIPPNGLLGPSYRRITPYIYSDEQVEDLLDAAAQLGPQGGLRPHTYVTLFGLLASTGMRISEALGLTLDDVDLDRGLLQIRASKFKQSRLLPVHGSTSHALRDYREHRQRYHPRAVTKAFFLTERATSLKYWRTNRTFTALRRRLGWEELGCARSPRIHDLRHRFAIKRLSLWYKAGVDIDHAIHQLSTYLGHARITDTYWYLSAAPELLAAAAGRFDNFPCDESGGAT